MVRDAKRSKPLRQFRSQWTYGWCRIVIFLARRLLARQAWQQLPLVKRGKIDAANPLLQQSVNNGYGISRRRQTVSSCLPPLFHKTLMPKHLKSYRFGKIRAPSTKRNLQIQPSREGRSMLTASKRGFYLLAVAGVMVFFLSGRIARADGISDTNHDELTWSAGESGDHSDTSWTSNGESENSDSDGSISVVENGNESDNGGDGENVGEDGDPAAKSVPEPSSLALLTIGMLGVMALARRQARNSGVRQLA